MQIQRKKRRPAHGPSKSELRASRGEQEARERSQSGTLAQKFPDAASVELDLRIEATSGAELDHVQRRLSPNEPLTLNVECPGGCGGGQFLLSDAVEALLQAGSDQREGMAICQAVSYADPRVPCGTKLFYRIEIRYSGAREGASENPPA